MFRWTRVNYCKIQDTTKRTTPHLLHAKLNSQPKIQNSNFSPIYCKKHISSLLCIFGYAAAYPKLTVIDGRWMRTAGKSECVSKRTKRVNACFVDRESRVSDLAGFRADTTLIPAPKSTIALLFFSRAVAEHAKIVIRNLHRCARHSHRLSGAYVPPGG